MTALRAQRLPAGHALFARYAYPPNELGYCGPGDAEVLLRGDNPAEVAVHARAFDGTWPYLTALAAAAGTDDPLDADVVGSYWVGGALLDRVDPTSLLETLRRAFTGQVTGLLDELTGSTGVLAHHSFHVFVVYPWVRFLDRDAATALNALQNCRIRWGTVESVDGEYAQIRSQQLMYDAQVLALGDAITERVQWRTNGVSLVNPPRPGDVVSAHWHRICDTVTASDVTALATATQVTLDLVNTARLQRR